MSDTDSPVELLFQMQRDTIKGTEAVIENFIDISTDFGEGFSGGIDAQRELQEQTLELTRQSMHQYIDAAEAVTTTSMSVDSVPDPADSLDDLREAVDDTFDSLLEGQEDVFERMDESYDDFGEDAQENLETQVEMLIEANERIESQLFDSVERFVEQAEDAEVLSEGMEEQFERMADQFEEQAGRLEDLDDQFETIDITAPRED